MGCSLRTVGLLALVVGAVGRDGVAQNIPGTLTLGSNSGSLVIFPDGTFQLPPARNQSAYDSGYGDGYALGYETGLGEGRLRGVEEGTAQGRDAGFDFGWEQTFQPAFDLAYVESYPGGIDVGFAEGAEYGFQQGFRWAERQAAQQNGGGSGWCCGSSGAVLVSGDFGGFNGWSGSDVFVIQRSLDDSQYYYQLGFDEGKSVGQATGSQLGYEETFGPAYDAAYPLGLADGLVDGEAGGTEEGSIEGFLAGYDAGFNVSQPLGFDAGVVFFQQGDVGLAAFLRSLALEPLRVPEPLTSPALVAATLLAVRRRATT